MLIRVAKMDKGAALRQEDLGSNPHSPVHLLCRLGQLLNLSELWVLVLKACEDWL